MINLEEALWRGQQGYWDEGGGQNTDGIKRAGSGRIAGNGRCPGRMMTSGRCGAVWCGVEQRRGQSKVYGGSWGVGVGSDKNHWDQTAKKSGQGTTR